MESSMADLELGGVRRSGTGSILRGVAPSNVYATADGTDVVIAANADSIFARLCTVMGRPDLRTDPRFHTHGARGKSRQGARRAAHFGMDEDEAHR